MRPYSPHPARVLALMIALVGIATAQTPAALRFEVASIKASTFPSDEYKAGFLAGAGSCPNAPLSIADNRVTIQKARLCSLIRQAYQLQDYRIAFASGTKPKDDELFDIQATAAGEMTQDRARAMLQSLLAERFLVFPAVLVFPGASFPALKPGRRLFWNRDKMNVIRHQAPAENRHAPLPGVFLKQLKITATVGIAQEDVLPIVAPLLDVMRGAGKDEPRSTSHA